MKTIKAALIGLFTGVVNGLFGSGGGSVLVPCMERLLKTEEHKAHACAIAVILPLSIISAFLYFKKLDVDIISLAAVCLGGVVGGFLGAKLLGRIKPKYLHLIFGIFMIIGGVRML
jgi:hypothetical protein